LKIYSFRKVKLLNSEYYMVDYDFTTKNELRRGFYKELKPVLPGKIRFYSRTRSVIEVDEYDLAKKIFDLAVKYGGTACLRRASTIEES
jgi:hypothetical protein